MLLRICADLREFGLRFGSLPRLTVSFVKVENERKGFCFPGTGDAIPVGDWRDMEEIVAAKVEWAL